MGKVFDQNIPGACRYCSFSTKLSFGSDFLCRKRGIVLPDDFCRKYCYDPLKREPNKVTISRDYSEKDFEI